MSCVLDHSTTVFVSIDGVHDLVCSLKRSELLDLDGLFKAKTNSRSSSDKLLTPNLILMDCSKSWPILNREMTKLFTTLL